MSPGTRRVGGAVYAEQLLRRERGEGPLDLGMFIPGVHGSEQLERLELVGGVLGGRRFLSRRLQRALMTTDTPAEREALRAQGRLSSFGEYIAGKSGALSTLADFFYNFADPTLAVGKASWPASVVPL